MLKKILISHHRFPTIAQDLSKELGKLDVNVQIFFVDDYQTFFYRRMIKPLRKILRYIGFGALSKKIFSNNKYDYKNFITENFKKTCEKFTPDMILIIQGAPHSLEYISKLNCYKVAWWIEPSEDLEELLENSVAFDAYFCFSYSAADNLSKVKNNVYYLNHFVNTDIFKVVKSVQKKYDLVFVGNWSPWREEVINSILNVTNNIIIYGPRWKSKSKINKYILKNVHKGNHIEGASLNLLYNQSKVVLNISRVFGSTGLNMRFTESLAAGAFLLTDDVLEIPLHFKNRHHLMIYESTKHLQQLLKIYLKNDEMRERVAENGRSEVILNYSYKILADRIFNLYQT